MNNNLDLDNDQEINVPVNYRLEASEKQAKITGLLCIACAIAAMFFAALGTLPTFLSVSFLTFYFVFVLLAAAMGLVGYAEIKAFEKGWPGSAFLLISAALLFVLFLSVPLQREDLRLGGIYAIYGIFATLIPLLLTALVLITNKTALWKAFIPLSIPVLSVLAYPLAISVGFPLGASMLALGWGMLGVVAYQGRK